MSRTYSHSIDVSDAAGLGERAWVAFSIEAPDDLQATPHPVIAFAKPGGGYTKEYFSVALPGRGADAGSQAAWHANRGWIFVSVDLLGIGESSRHDLTRLNSANVAAAHVAAETELVARLVRGEIDSAIPPLAEPVILGMGQSLGGSMLIYQQGTHHSYDGIASLAYSPLHQNASGPPGSATYVSPYLLEEGSERAYSDPSETIAAADFFPGPISDAAIAWSFFYYEETDWDLIVAEVDDFPFRRGVLAPWHTDLLAYGPVNDAMSPGRLAPQAAAIRCPVLIVMGERDNVVDPLGEPKAFPLSTSVDLFICPRMGHMHNFASTREVFWRRIHTWGEWVREGKSLGAFAAKSRATTSGAAAKPQQTI